jgi:hypothetical protein
MFPAVFIQIEENPNCLAMDGQVFQPRSPGRPVAKVRVLRAGSPQWSEIVALGADGPGPSAQAYLVDDSGDGSCYLVVGGEWGLRLRETRASQEWSCDDKAQWGEPYLLLGGDGSDIEFAG